MSARTVCFLLSGMLVGSIVLNFILFKLAKSAQTRSDEFRQKCIRHDELRYEVMCDMSEVAISTRNLAGELADIKNQYRNLESMHNSLELYCSGLSKDLRDTKHSLMRNLSNSEGTTVKFDSPDLVKQVESMLSWIKSSSVVVYPRFFLTFEASKEVVDSTYKTLVEKFSGDDDDSSRERYWIEDTYKKIYLDHGWT